MILSRLVAVAAVSALVVSGCSSDDPVYSGPGCAFQEAEHPGFTPPTRDAALCGNGYDSSNIAAACVAEYHVCRESEWHRIYPEGSAPGGTLTTWGASQASRCVGGVWEADRPVDARTWDDSVCPGSGNESYNPWNNGKFILSDDGLTVLEGDGSWGDWDISFSPTSETAGYAVYCCRN